MESSNNQIEQQNKIDELYQLLSHEGTQNYLNEMEKLTICHTDLHKAAAAGMHRWALEVANLAPSLTRKLNHEGLSPMHLALRHGHDQTVRALMAFDSTLIRVKGRGLKTPLHYAAELENIELLTQFLRLFPSSIEDLTSGCETAMHVAIKKKKVEACKVLFGWMRRKSQENILNMKDEDGNTVLHIAASTNQEEVVKLIARYVKVNAKNLEGKTAIDLCSKYSQVKEILRNVGSRSVKEVDDSKSDPGKFRRTSLSLMDRFKNHIRITNSSDLRNVCLGVAILIATATYQGVLSPPGGFWQDGSPDSNTPSFAPVAAPPPPQAGHTPGTLIMDGLNSKLFFSFNSFTFMMSMSTILFILSGAHALATLTLLGSVGGMVLTYILSFHIIFNPMGFLKVPCNIVSTAIMGLWFVLHVMYLYAPTEINSLLRIWRRRIQQRIQQKTTASANEFETYADGVLTGGRGRTGSVTRGVVGQFIDDLSSSRARINLSGSNVGKWGCNFWKLGMQLDCCKS
ncbi:hypothetical protein SAY86_027285 [Trapa natans]|uniref:PGG domain-containing protein n=1 Tax=Trapa natans TaxID=22666 RepID=A0AAN7KST1_TRANT|nr:hypothetical protein SAY86_027285 [Trapa natans]